MTDTTQTVAIGWVERLRNSVNGNPRWQLFTEHESFKMQSDASDSYSITETNLNGKAVELTLTPAGNVRRFKVVELRDVSEDW